MYLRGPSSAEYFAMYIGSEKVGDGTALFMKKMKIHSKFLDMSLGFMERSDYDIALVLTTTDIMDKYVLPVSTKAEQVGQDIHFCGFGASAKNSTKTSGYVFPDTMLCSTFSVLDETSEYAETTFLTTGQPAPGDSGGAGIWLEDDVWKIGGKSNAQHNYIKCVQLSVFWIDQSPQ